MLSHTLRTSIRHITKGESTNLDPCEYLRYYFNNVSHLREKNKLYILLIEYCNDPRNGNEKK